MKYFTIEITPEMLSLIAEVDEFKGKWSALQNLSPEILNALKKVATIESIASSTRIEGVKLSDAEVEKLLNHPLKHHSFKNRDEEEVAGYAETMNLLFASWREISLTENHMKQLHAILLKFSSKDTRHRGEYKKFPNHVEAFDHSGKSLGILFATTTPFATPRAMQELIEKTREAQAEKILHPLLIIAMFIVEFLAIHPFQDGNGRLSRILTTLLLLQAGYHYVAFSSLEHIIEENKDQYYLALRKTQMTLKNHTINWQPWVHFFLLSLKQQKDKLLKKIEHENLLTQRLPILSVKILELTKERGRITIADIEKLTQAPKGTIKARLRDLVKNQQLILHGKGRATWYTLK